jgi:hypothetical protein
MKRRSPTPVMQNGKENLCVWIEPALKDRLREIAQSNYRTLTNEVTKALNEYANAKQKSAV